MIKNIIFDMGNVLIHFDRGLFLDRFGVTEPEDRKLLMNEVFLSVEWPMTDRGSLRDEEAAAKVCERLPEKYHETVYKLFTQWDKPLLPMEGMPELIKKLKEKGYGIYLLSNASKRQKEYWSRFPGNELFDGTLVSADVSLVKPQQEIYSFLYEKFSLNPTECVFIDDSTPNVEGAIWSGMNAIVFHGDVDELLRKLRELKIDI